LRLSHIERRSERGRHLEGDRNATARKPQDDYILAARITLRSICQQFSGVAAVPIDSHGSKTLSDVFVLR
jgi:hypothetical protein